MVKRLLIALLMLAPPAYSQVTMQGSVMVAGGVPVLQFQGTFSSATTYKLNDIVLASGVDYISLISPNLNNTPASTPSAWAPFQGGAGGGLTSVGISVPSWLQVIGSPLTSNGTLPITPATGQASHQVIGTCGTATSYAQCTLVPGDIPSLPYLPNSTSLPATTTATTHQWFASYSASTGLFVKTQPAFADLSGNATLAQLPVLSANTVLGALTATTPSGLAMPSCSGAANALIWTTGTGFGCNTIAGGGGGAFSALTSGTNTIATMVVGTGAALSTTGSGTISATSAPASALTGYTGTAGHVVTQTGTLAGMQDSGVVLASLAPLASPALTGTPTAPTATLGTNTTQIATTAFVLANSITGSGATGFLPIFSGAKVLTSSLLDYGITNAGFFTFSKPTLISDTVDPGFIGLAPNGVAPAVQAGFAGWGIGATLTTAGYYRFPDAPGTGFWFGTNSAGIVTNTFIGSSGTGNVALVGSPAFTGTATGVNFTLSGAESAATYKTATVCANAGGTCGSAAAGAVTIAAGNTTVTVATTAVTAGSTITLTPDDSLTIAATTCNTTLATLVGGMAVTARTPGTSFTVTFNGAIVTNPLCFSYLVEN